MNKKCNTHELLLLGSFILIFFLLPSIIFFLIFYIFILKSTKISAFQLYYCLEKENFEVEETSENKDLEEQ